jgi:hypothetical protein
MGRYDSWHAPRLPTYHARPANEIIFVVFLERLPESTRAQIPEKLKDTDEEWATAKLDTTVKPRDLRPVPWIRDHFPSSNAILQTLNLKEHNSCSRYVLVDSGWEAETCIAATWVNVGGDKEPTLQAARVPMSLANVILTVIDSSLLEQDPAGPFVSAFGEEGYAEYKVDFYKDRKILEPQEEVPPYELPSSLKGIDAFSTSKIVVISLQTLPEQEIMSLKKEIFQSREEKEEQPDLHLINWEGDSSPTRQDLIKIFEALEAQLKSDKALHIAYTFFIDNIMQSDHHHGLQIIAAARCAQWGHQHPEHQITLFPVHHEKLIDLWKAAMAADPEPGNKGRIPNMRMQDADIGLEFFDIWRMERALDLDYPPDFHCNTSFPAVFYLRQFNLDEERTIRKKLSELYPGVEEGEDWGKEFAFIGYPWSSSSARAETDPHHTIQDLRTLFEQTDPLSPFHKKDPRTKIPIRSYPSHFFALDDKILDPENPKVILVSCLDFYHESNELGWYYG